MSGTGSSSQGYGGDVNSKFMTESTHKCVAITISLKTSTGGESYETKGE